MKCRVRLFYQVLPCQQGDVSLSPWAVVRQETDPIAGQLAWGTELWFYFFGLGLETIKGVRRRVEHKILDTAGI